MPSSRQIASSILTKVIKEQQTLTQGFEMLSAIPTEEHGLIKDLCFGVCRYYFSLCDQLNYFLDKPLKAKDTDIKIVCLIGLYELQHHKKPDYAVVNECVAVCHALKKSWAKGLVNAVLRHFLRSSDEVNLSLTGTTNHPEWLMNKITLAWPHEAKSIFEANSQHPPLTLRVNLTAISREDYLIQLSEKGITAIPQSLSPCGITLTSPCLIQDCPGFDKGWIFVQDAAAQLAAIFLQPDPHARVLDACAAPGGKTIHLLQQESTLNLIALDKDPKRLMRVNENAKRAGIKVTTLTADAAEYENWWDGNLFDAILCDAPCSATGVIRRHPDIKLCRNPSDIALLVEQQRRLLKALWSTLKIGGRLLYTTCSILPEENEENMADFVGAQPDAEVIPLTAAAGRALHYGWQILPGEEDADGFYYALLEKRA